MYFFCTGCFMARGREGIEARVGWAWVRWEGRDGRGAEGGRKVPGREPSCLFMRARRLWDGK